MQPLVTICIITYNHERSIAQAIDSVLMQVIDFKVEIIIADDCSTDKTRDILSAFRSKHPGIIQLILQQRNVGAAQNWLDLLNAPSSKYIAYFEGDDFWTDAQKLQKQVDFLEKNLAYSGCFHETNILNEIDRSDNKIIAAGITEDISAEDTLSQFALFHTSSLMFRRNALILPDWISKVASGDMALFSILSASGPLKKIPGIMSTYRKHPAGITQTDKVKNNLDKDRIVLLKLLDEYHHFKYSDKANAIISKHQECLRLSSRIPVQKSFLKRLAKAIFRKVKKD